MRKILLTAVLLIAGTQLHATSITGVLALAGLDTFTGNTIHFQNPATVLEATGSLAAMKGTTTLDLNNIDNFGTALGQTFFSWTNASTTVTLNITSFVVTRDSANFLNVLGTGNVTQTGFDETPYNFSLTSTKPDGITSYTIGLVGPESAIPEPTSLLLLGTGLMSLALFYRRRSC